MTETLKRRAKIGLTMACLAMFVAPNLNRAADTIENPKDPSNTRSVMKATPDGVGVALSNPLPEKPAPLLIDLSGIAQDTIEKSSFFQAGKFLVPHGYLCASIDLPCHGTQQTDKLKGLSGWGRRGAAGDDFVAEFNKRMKSAVDYLIAEKLADPEKIVACGTSRGGFLALRYAAFDPRVKAVVGYSPVTDLRQLSEFKIAANTPAVDQMSIGAYVKDLVGRPVYLVIGDRDNRVGTDAAVTFARQLSEAALKANVTSNVQLHVISEPRANHTTPAGYDKLSAAWIYHVIDGGELFADSK